MKKIITILIAIIAVASFTSCKSREQKEMEKTLAQVVNVRGVSYFGKCDSIRLADEVKSQIERQKFYLNWHESFAEAFQEASEDESQSAAKRTTWGNKADKYKNAVKEDKQLISYLESIDDEYKDDYNKVSFVIYEMHYMYAKDNGVRECDICYGKFDKNRNLVAYKMSKNPTWTVIGDDCSIPNYELNPSLAR